jgi:hypothetical protein
MAIPRRVGGLILWGMEKAFPVNPELPRVGANIIILEGETPERGNK